MKFSFEENSQTFLVDLMPGSAGNSYRVAIGEKSADVQLLEAKEAKVELLIDGKRVTAYVSSDNAKRWVTVNGQTFVLSKSPGARAGRHGQHYVAGQLTAPMPGQVRAVHVSESESVTKGQTLLVLEAMKMEIRMQAPRDGIVKKLFVKQGQTVEREQIVIEISEN